MRLLLVAVAAVWATPSVLGELNKELFPTIRADTHILIDDTIDEVAFDVTADLEQQISMDLAWIPASIKDRMILFIHKRLVPKLDSVLDELEIQLNVIDTDVDLITEKIQEKVRAIFGAKKEVKAKKSVFKKPRQQKEVAKETTTTIEKETTSPIEKETITPIQSEISPVPILPYEWEFDEGELKEVA